MPHTAISAACSCQTANPEHLDVAQPHVEAGVAKALGRSGACLQLQWVLWSIPGHLIENLLGLLWGSPGPGAVTLSILGQGSWEDPED